MLSVNLMECNVLMKWNHITILSEYLTHYRNSKLKHMCLITRLDLVAMTLDTLLCIDLKSLWMTLGLVPSVHTVIRLRRPQMSCRLVEQNNADQMLLCNTASCSVTAWKQSLLTVSKCKSISSSASPSLMDALERLCASVSAHVHVCIFHYSLGRISWARWGTGRILRGRREGRIL